MKRPTQTALIAALYALNAARDTHGTNAPQEKNNALAARVLLAHMKLVQGNENVKWAKTEIFRACIMTGTMWFGDTSGSDMHGPKAPS